MSPWLLPMEVTRFLILFGNVCRMYRTVCPGCRLLSRFLVYVYKMESAFFLKTSSVKKNCTGKFKSFEVEQFNIHRFAFTYFVRIRIVCATLEWNISSLIFLFYSFFFWRILSKMYQQLIKSGAGMICTLRTTPSRFITDFIFYVFIFTSITLHLKGFSFTSGGCYYLKNNSAEQLKKKVNYCQEWSEMQLKVLIWKL